MPKLTHEEFDRRVTEAMKGGTAQGRQRFSPSVERMRQTARRPASRRPQLPMARRPKPIQAR